MQLFYVILCRLRPTNLLIIKKPYAIISNVCHTTADFCFRAHNMGCAKK